MADTVTGLAVREAYKLWAGSYDSETAVSAVENRVVSAEAGSLAGRSLLDAGCGTGRRLPAPSGGFRRAVGVDLVPEMLRVGRYRGCALAAGDVRALPFSSGIFDVLWCRLALGHVADVSEPYRELARVAQPGAMLVVSDFHPDAVGSGHRRTFRDASGRPVAIEHYVHQRDEHVELAGAAGWRLHRALDAPPGREERAIYERAGRLEQLDREASLPLVLVMWFHR